MIGITKPRIRDYEANTVFPFLRHRLSTITHADQIIVLHAGTIVERGNHADLLAAKGVYCSMWNKQVTAERALDVARQASQKAKRALKAANMDGKSKSGTQIDGYESHGSTTELLSDNSQPHGNGEAHPSASSSDIESTHEQEPRSKSGPDS